MTTALVGLAAAVAGGCVFILGWDYPDIVAAVAPGRAPIPLLNEHLLSGAAGLVIAQFFLQQFDLEAWPALLCLPVCRATLVGATQITAVASPITVIPLLGLSGVVASTIVPATSLLEAVFWATGVLLAVAIAHFIHVRLRVAWARRRWSVVVGVSTIVFGLVVGDVLGSAVVREASVWLFGGVQQGNIGPFLLLAVGTFALAVTSTKALRRRLYREIDWAGRTRRRRLLSLDSGGQGRLWPLIRLEAALIFRNRGPREQLLFGGGALLFFVYLIVGDTLSLFSLGMAPFMLGLLLPVTYGQFAFAWHGKHFEGLLTRASPGRLVRAVLVVLVGMAVGPLILAMPVVAWADPFLAAPMAAFALYHAGITVPTVVWAGILGNRNWVNPEQSRYTFAGGSARGVVLMALLAMPPVLLASLGGIPFLLVGVAVLGGLGLGAVSGWLSWLERALRQRRHAMLQGFRGQWLSPYKWHW